MDIQEKTLEINRGFCPSHMFFRYKQVNPISVGIEAVDKLLGDREKFMVYPFEDYDQRFEWSSIVEFLYGDFDIHGASAEVANHIRNVVPNCLWGKFGRIIRLHDINTPRKLDDIVLDYESGRYTFDNGIIRKGSKIIFESIEWFILIDSHDNNEDTPVDIYIHKK